MRTYYDNYMGEEKHEFCCNMLHINYILICNMLCYHGMF